MPKLELYLSKIIKYGLYAILLTPLAFWPKALFPFLTPKFILFQILVEIVFAAWLALLVLRNSNLRIHSNSTNNTENNIRSIRMSFVDWNYIKSHWLILSLLTFFGISFLSAIFGIDFSRSFWGIGARMTGLFTELHFLAWFLVLASVATHHNPNLQIHSNSTNKTDKIRSIRMSFVDLNHYVNFSFIISLVIAATAFYQNSVWGLSLGSTFFNNPTFVAPYFIFHFFWGLYQTLSLNNTNTRMNANDTNKNSYWKNWLFASGTALLFVAIVLTQIRGAILGLLIGIFAFGLLLIFSNILNQRLRNILIAIYLIFAIGITGFWSFRDLPLIQNISILKKITTASLAETTVQTRLLTWQLALKGFRSAGWRTVLGVGPENFNYVFNAHYNPHFLKFGGGGFGETWFDKPHNAFLEILTETGIIGGLAYVIIWLTAGFLFLKLWRNGEKLFSTAIFSTFVAYLISIFFSFDSFGSWFGLFLMLSFLASHYNSNLSRFYRGLSTKSEQIYPKKLFVVFACISILGLLGVNLSIWRANLADADALRTFPKDPKQGIALFKKSLNYFTPYKAEYQFDLLASVGGALEKKIPMANLEDIINFSLDEANKAILTHPKNAAYYTDILRVYNVLGELGRDPQILAQAEAFGKRSLELSPNRQETLFYLTKNSLLEGDTKSAVSYMIQAVKAESSIGLSHWYLGLAYIADNQKEKGIVEIKSALELGYSPQNKAEEEFIKNLGL